MNLSTRIASLLMLVLFAGCGDDTTSATTQDLATVSDMSVSSDLKMLTCANILACISGWRPEPRLSGCVLKKARPPRARPSTPSLAAWPPPAAPSTVAATAAPVPPTAAPAAQTCVSNTAANALNASAPCNAEYAACAGS